MGTNKLVRSDGAKRRQFAFRDIKRRLLRKWGQRVQLMGMLRRQGALLDYCFVVCLFFPTKQVAFRLFKRLSQFSDCSSSDQHAAPPEWLLDYCFVVRAFPDVPLSGSSLSMLADLPASALYAGACCCDTGGCFLMCQ